MGGEEEHSLARNLLNFEARDRRLCRGGERRSLACPRQINHGRGAPPKANYVECFLGKSSRRLCKSSLALVDIQIRLGAGARWHASAPQCQVEELHRGDSSGKGLGRLGFQRSLPGKLLRAKMSVCLSHVVVVGLRLLVRFSMYLCLVTFGSSTERVLRCL